MSGHIMYGLIACELSHVGKVVDPGDITLLLNCFESISGSVFGSDCKEEEEDEEDNQLKHCPINSH